MGEGGGVGGEYVGEGKGEAGLVGGGEGVEEGKGVGKGKGQQDLPGSSSLLLTWQCCCQPAYAIISLPAWLLAHWHCC